MKILDSEIGYSKFVGLGPNEIAMINSSASVYQVAIILHVDATSTITGTKCQQTCGVKGYMETLKRVSERFYSRQR